MTAPALSSTIARILLSESPQHAWSAHPELNPNYVREEKVEFDLGTAAHAQILEGRTDRIVIVNAKDWKTKAAQEARDLARQEKKQPMLAHQFDAMTAMVAAFKDRLDQFQEKPKPLQGGKAEVPIQWEDEGVLCKARLDWLHDGFKVIDDLKTTRASAHPDQWGRTLFASGYDVQAAFYLRGARRLLGTQPEFRFVVAELDPPYAVSVIALDPQALEIADKKVTHALKIWRECLETDKWPGYPNRTMYVEMPPWERAKYEAMEYFSRRDSGEGTVDEL